MRHRLPRWPLHATAHLRPRGAPPRAFGGAPELRVGGGAGARAGGGDLPWQEACHGGCLSAPESLPLIRPCRSAWRTAAGFSCGAWVWPSQRAPPAGALVLWLGRPGKLLLPGPCLLGPASSSCRGSVFLARQAPLAGALSSWLVYLVFARP